MREGGELFYLLGDHLGSTSLTLDAGGNKVAEQRYKPYGSTRYEWGTVQTNYQYTGQRKVNLGIYYYQARFYDAPLGQFLSADSIIPSPGNVLDWNRYLYTRANPIIYVDPNGHLSCSPFRPCEPATPTSSVFTLDMSEQGLVTKYQQNQGKTSYCMSYSISTSLNILYNTNTTGQDVVDSFTYSDIPQLTWARYSWGIFGEAVLPNQGKRVINELSGLILGQDDNLPTTETMDLTFDEMIEIIEDPNRMAVFVFNTEPGKWTSGHAVVLAAYDPNRGFGFLNSGWGRKPNELTWFTRDELKDYMEDPIGLWNPHFLVISRPDQSRGRRGQHEPR